MKKMTLNEAVTRAQDIREIFHQLEVHHHGSPWSVQEDALAFLTDAGLVGRLTMAQQGRWPMERETGQDELEHKLGECMWWLIVLGERMGIDAEGALESFLTRTERQLKGSARPASRRPKAKSSANGGKKAKRK